MSAKKFLRLIAGQLSEAFGVTSSSGASNDGDIPALDSTGRIDMSMMPVGVGPDTLTITASENLTTGAFVNVWNSGGTGPAQQSVQNADAALGRRAVGFVLAPVSTGQPALVYFGGPNTSLVGLTPGTIYYLGTAGTSSPTAPSTPGYLSQEVGEAISTSEIDFKPTKPITLA